MSHDSTLSVLGVFYVIYGIAIAGVEPFFALLCMVLGMISVIIGSADVR